MLCDSVMVGTGQDASVQTHNMSSTKNGPSCKLWTSVIATNALNQRMLSITGELEVKVHRGKLCAFCLVFLST